ncbi:MAG: hypothetical protein LBU85_09050 [Treponema sp.]|nr:hypothetical protein [Treponema sp.]
MTLNVTIPLQFMNLQDVDLDGRENCRKCCIMARRLCSSIMASSMSICNYGKNGYFVEDKPVTGRITEGAE